MDQVARSEIEKELIVVVSRTDEGIGDRLDAMRCGRKQTMTKQDTPDAEIDDRATRDDTQCVTSREAARTVSFVSGRVCREQPRTPNIDVQDRGDGGWKEGKELNSKSFRLICGLI